MKYLILFPLLAFSVQLKAQGDTTIFRGNFNDTKNSCILEKIEIKKDSLFVTYKSSHGHMFLDGRLLSVVTFQARRRDVFIISNDKIKFLHTERGQDRILTEYITEEHYK